MEINPKKSYQFKYNQHNVKIHGRVVKKSSILTAATVTGKIMPTAPLNAVILLNGKKVPIVKIIEHYCLIDAKHSDDFMELPDTVGNKFLDKLEIENEPYFIFAYKYFFSSYNNDENKANLINMLNASASIKLMRLTRICAAIVASQITDVGKGKGGSERIRKLFGIKNDFTPEEEAAIREQNGWLDYREKRVTKPKSIKRYDNILVQFNDLLKKLK